MTIREELEALQSEEGVLQAETAVLWAQKHPKSELHSKLEWDNDKAGHAHRVWQMRQLISLVITHDGTTQAFISLTIDRTEPRGGYRRLADVLSVERLRECALRDALDELERVQRKYEHLKELAGVWREVVKVKPARRRPAGKETHGRAVA